MSAIALAPKAGHAADDGDWPIASPDSQGVDTAALAKFLEAPGRSLPALRGIVVVRNGFLIGEGYQPNVRSTGLFRAHSVTKSVASMLVGIAIEQGKIRSVEQTLGELLPEAAAAVPASAVNGLTLAQILTQTSGLPGDTGSSDRLRSLKDMMAHAQGLPLEPASPPYWRYSNAGVALISSVLARATGGSTEAFAKSALFAPLGIDDYLWERDAAAGVTTASGLILNTRDMAKFAWVMADGGRWRGRQIVPAKWVAESTQPRTVPRWKLSPMTDMGYGYLWFTGKLHGRPAFWGWGYGAQYALAVPSLGLAIATLAAPPPGTELVKQNDEIMSLAAEIVALAR